MGEVMGLRFDAKESAKVNTEKKERTFTQRGSMYRGAMASTAHSLGAPSPAGAASPSSSASSASAPSAPASGAAAAPSWAKKSAAAAPAAAAAAPAAAAAGAGAPAKVVTDGSKFDLATLKAARPGDGSAVDAAGIVWSAKEAYLREEDFKAALGCSAADFDKLPKWKRDAAKKAAGLF